MKCTNNQNQSRVSSKHFAIHFLLFFLESLNRFLQISNFFLHTVVIGLELLNSEQVSESEIIILFPLLRLTSPVACLGQPVWSIVQLLLENISTLNQLSAECSGAEYLQCALKHFLVNIINQMAAHFEFAFQS